MKRKTAMRCTKTILIILLMLLTTVSAFAMEKYDYKKYKNPEKFRISPSGITTSDITGDENNFGTLKVKYVVDNMDGGKWVSQAWAQNIIFHFGKTPAYLQDFGPGRTFTIVDQVIDMHYELVKDEKETITLDEGRYLVQARKEWWAANGRPAKTWLTAEVQAGMFIHLKFKEEEPIDEYLNEEKKSFLESGPEGAERSVEEPEINKRRVLLEKEYYPLHFSEGKDYLVDSDTYRWESANTSWIYKTIIEPEEFPEIYFVTTTKVFAGFRYERHDASGEIYQHAEDLYQDYLKQIERTNDIVAREMITMEPEVIYEEPVIGKPVGKKGSDQPAHFSISTNADKDSGETAVSIPEALAIVIIGGGAALAGTGTGGKSGEEEEKKQSRYKMCLNKNFGDTILVGDRLPIYARIVEITPQGEERSRSDLSAMIRISSPEYLVVNGEAMSGEYRSAYVEAPGTDTIPETAVVSLRFEGAMGSFTNNVTFKIAERKIIFAQENLTLPAGYDKTERLPFAVFGLSADAVVTASITREDGYSVEVEPGEEPDLYYALITEKIKTTREAGDYESYTLTIKAESGEQTLTGELAIYRLHMGLRLDLNSIGCYAEEYDPVNHQSNKFLFTAGKRRLVPAESKATLTLFSWDAESHKVLQIAPPSLEFQIQAAQESDQSTIEQLGIQCQITEEANGGRGLIFRCCRGALDAPTRLNAKLSLVYKRSEEEPYLVEKEVQLRSQPQRRFNSTDENMAALESDARIRDWLMSVKSNIWNMNFLNNLFPLVKFIDVMLDGYHEAYGFDPGQVETVREIWSGFLDGDVLGANAEPEKVTLGDEMRLFIGSFMDTTESVEKSLGFWSRLAVGVATLGCSEVVFASVEVVREMKEYVDNGGDSAWDAMIVGAKVAGREYLWDLGFRMAFAGAAAVKKAVPPAQAMQALREMKDNMKESGQRFLTSITGRQTKAVVSETVDATRRCAARAHEILEIGRKGMRKTVQQVELDEAFAAGKVYAREQVDNLRAAAWQFELNPTSAANRRMMNETALAVQQNKLAMNILADSTRPELDVARKALNETLEVINKNTDKIALQKLSSLTGIPADQIKIMNASSSSRELMRRGKKITYDRDWTAYYTNSKGETVYFDQRLTEQVYADSLYESTKGAKPKSAEVSSGHMRSLDHTAIEDVAYHPESYGDDLPKMIDASQHGQALGNSAKAAEAVAYKIKDRVKHSRELIEQAAHIADPAQRQLVLAEAAGELLEGGRMATKQFDNIINLRDVARKTGSEGSKISGRLRTAVEICKEHFKRQARYNLTDLQTSLESVGYTLESMADELADTLLLIG